MRILKPHRGDTVTFTVTEQEKNKIASEAEKEKRTMSGYIRYRLRDVLEGVNNDRE